MVLEPKFSASDGEVREVGVNSALRAKLRENIENGRVKYTTVATSICAGVTATGQIPRVSGFENTGGQFFLDNDRTRPDGLLDDQALFVDSENGLIVVLGCAHAGVVNTLEHIQQLESDRKIHAVLGGMHLVNADETRIGKTIDAFRRFGIDRIGPAHCTGREATSQIWSSFRDRCFPCFVGTRVSF
jgi:7,8-dihydropterin-6-yl-methyl-4-(beta-D-ribofuranosyl)aminobenzene 5'-phosphate synthase